MIDRLSIRGQPAGWPLMYQWWGHLLFLHWPLPEALVRPLIPARLQIDTFAGCAWIGVVPFTFWGTRPPLVPAIPLASASHELNVRTYVHLDGVPGVWFFSLDAANALAVWGARLTYYLPYFWARMHLEKSGPLRRFTSRRRHPGAAAAEFAAEWTLGDSLPPAPLDSQDFFLLERYCLYAEHRGRLYRARIHHRPWPLRRATLGHLTSTMLQAHGLSAPSGEPLVHALAEPLHVGIWPEQCV